jgi:enamine deaminase RidA (YjgF/YER057c/UK114 family)
MSTQLILGATVSLGLLLCAAFAPNPDKSKQKQSDVRFIDPPTLAKSPRYSQIAEVRSGRVIYISGQVSMDKEGKPVGVGDFKAQSRQVFANLQAALEAVDAGPENIVKLTSFVTRREDFPVFAEVRKEFFAKSPQMPASTTLVVAGLVTADCLVEVEAVVVLPE